jgi:hypothetical protein
VHEFKGLDVLFHLLAQAAGFLKRGLGAFLNPKLEQRLRVGAFP